MPSGLQTTGWTRIPIASVEDLTDAILGAGLEVTQMSRAPVTASLAFAEFADGLWGSPGFRTAQAANRPRYSFGVR